MLLALCPSPSALRRLPFALCPLLLALCFFLMTWRLGVLVSHPIQYLSPWFRHLATRLDLEVFYAHHQSARGQAEAGFGVEFDWDVPLLEGYSYRWLQNVARKPGLRSFGGCDTPEIYDIVRRGKYDAFLIFGWNRKSSIQAIFGCARLARPITRCR